MKILQVNKYYHPTIGGIETFVKEIAEGLSENLSWQMDVLTCHDQPGRATSTETINSVTVYRTKIWRVLFSMPVSLRYLFLFRKLAPQYDLILLHHPFPLGFLAYLLFGRTKPMVVWYFADISRQKFIGFLIRPLIHAILKLAKKIIIYSGALRKSAILLKNYQDKILVVNYGIDTKQYQPSEQLLEAAAQIKSQYSKPLLLSVGRLVSYKGYGVLLEAMTDIDAQAVIVGNGPLKNQLEEQIQLLGLQQKVQIIDAVPDLRPYYVAADIFVLPSVTAAETLAIVQLEAMATGTPVINTSLPTGVPEVSLHMQTGLTVTPGDHNALKSAIVRLLSDSQLRTSFANAASQRAQTNFDKQLFLRQLQEIFTQTQS